LSAKELYKHLSFKQKWRLSNETIFQLGQCDAIIKALSAITGGRFAQL